MKALLPFWPTCPAHFNILYLITLTILGEQGNIIVIHHFQILNEKWRRQKCLVWKITLTSCFKSIFYFHMNRFNEPKYLKVFTFSYKLLLTMICSFAIMARWHPTSIYLVFNDIIINFLISNRIGYCLIEANWTPHYKFPCVFLLYTFCKF